MSGTGDSLYFCPSGGCFSPTTAGTCPGHIVTKTHTAMDCLPRIFWRAVLIAAIAYVGFAVVSNVRAGTPTGRFATCLVAGYDAPAQVKLDADYVADGTDDQVEVQNCVNGAGRIALAGTFNLSAHVRLISHLEIDGFGWQGAYLRASGTPDALLSDEAIGLNNLAIRHLTLDAGTAGTQTIKITGAGGYRVRIASSRLLYGETQVDNVTFAWLVDNYVNGGTLRCSRCSDFHIEGNTVENNGINAGTGVSGIVAHNVVKNHSGSAIDIGSSQYIVVEGNTAYGVQNCVWTEATAAPSHDLVISNNVCKGGTGVGIVLLGVSDVVVSGNQVTGFDWGILLDGPVQDALVADTLIQGTLSHGVWARDSATGIVQNVVIEGLQIRDGNVGGGAGRGLWLRGAQDVLVQGVRIEGVYQFGLLESDGAFAGHLSGNHRIVDNDFRRAGTTIMQLDGTGGGTFAARNGGVDEGLPSSPVATSPPTPRTR